MVETTLERRRALIELLSRPDSPDLRRGHRRTLEGRVDRHLMLRDLAARFVQWHMVQQEERPAEHDSSAARVLRTRH